MVWFGFHSEKTWVTICTRRSKRISVQLYGELIAAKFYSVIVELVERTFKYKVLNITNMFYLWDLGIFFFFFFFFFCKNNHSPQNLDCVYRVFLYYAYTYPGIISLLLWVA